MGKRHTRPRRNGPNPDNIPPTYLERQPNNTENYDHDNTNGGDGISNSGEGVSKSRTWIDRYHNSGFNSNWKERFPNNDKINGEISKNINNLFSSFDISKYFDQNNETTFTSDLLSHLNGKTINLDQIGEKKVISFSFVQNELLVKNPDTKDFLEKKIGSDFIIEVIESNINNQNLNSNIFLIQSKKVIKNIVTKLEDEKDNFNTLLASDKFLSKIDYEKEKCNHDYTSISQALRMICNTNDRQSFFLLFQNQTELSKFIFALDIFHWRIS